MIVTPSPSATQVSSRASGRSACEITTRVKPSPVRNSTPSVTAGLRPRAGRQMTFAPRAIDSSATSGWSQMIHVGSPRAAAMTPVAIRRASAALVGSSSAPARRPLAKSKDLMGMSTAAGTICRLRARDRREPLRSGADGDHVEDNEPQSQTTPGDSRHGPRGRELGHHGGSSLRPQRRDHVVGTRRTDRGRDQRRAPQRAIPRRLRPAPRPYGPPPTSRTRSPTVISW